MNRKNRFFAFLLVLVLLVAAFPCGAAEASTVINTVSSKINGINTVRRENYLVIYNRCGQYTQTNIYGYEVVVKAGVVTSVGGNNSYIPAEEGSFVVSGHGTAIKWLQDNVLIGMKASYTDSAVTFTYDNDSVLYNLETEVVKMHDTFDNAKATYRIIDYSGLSQRISAAKASFGELKSAYEKDSSYDLNTNSQPLLEEVEAIFNECVESKTVEIRGIWIRPTQTDAKQVDDYVQTLYDAGINMLCIETLYNSTMIMPMPEDSLFEQNPNWKGFDMLQAYIDSCHKRDMELHIWLPIYYVGHGGSSNTSMSVGTKKPEWRSLTNTGSYYAPDDSDKFIFLSPANPEVKQFLLSTYKYILQKYDIDGFQLDYIRYTGRGSVDFGYDKATLDAFRAKYEFTPQYNTNADYWDEWVAFRAGFVTDMVKSVRELIDEINPKVLLTADVSPDFDYAKNYIYQDVKTWLARGYLNMLHPMAYGESYIDQMQEYIAKTGNVYTGVGIGAYLEEYDAKDLLRQANKISTINATGEVFFESSSFLKKGCGELLTKTLWRNRAITPTYDKWKAFSLLLKQAKIRIENAILPFGGMTKAEADMINAKLDNALTDLPLYQMDKTVGEVKSAKEEIDLLPDATAKKALLGDIDYALNIIGEGSGVRERIYDYFGGETINGINILIGFQPDSVESMNVKTVIELLYGKATVTDKNGIALSDDTMLGTGCIIKRSDAEYTVVIKGDVNGDGIIDSIDYLVTKKIILGNYLPDEFQNRAASITDGITPSSIDYLKIKKHILGTWNLFA